jgi:hypothetical protein
MILGFKQKFKDGTPTNFESKILTGEKIHSLREGDRWRAGKSIQMAFGVRTKKYRQFNINNPELQTCISRQRIFMTHTYEIEITIGYKYLMPHEIDLLIKNDGLTRQQFIDWFFPNKKDEWIGEIIHWTNFRY